MTPIITHLPSICGNIKNHLTVKKPAIINPKVISKWIAIMQPKKITAKCNAK
jgi:hypothetical protein